MTTRLVCPVCGGGLTLGAAAATCANAHSFDRARSGYLNLLLVKQSAEPGDSAALFALARLEHRRGMRQRAAETYRRLLDIDAIASPHDRRRQHFQDDVPEILNYGNDHPADLLRVRCREHPNESDAGEGLGSQGSGPWRASELAATHSPVRPPGC